MRMSRTCLVIALVAASVALRATPVAAQAGPEQTQKFLKTIEGTVKAIGESRAQLQKTVATYNSITEMTAKDLKDAYKDLNKDVAESEKKVAEGRPKVDEMNTAAEAYFAAWRASAAEISDPSLRKRSEDRLADTQARFGKILAAGKDARQHFDTLMKDVKDQSTYLGHDLNASAIASLKPDAAKFNGRANAVFTKVDGVTKDFDEFMTSMKP
jgi:phosphoenolpyruvate-protein kinase (PTS system EI component)